VKTTKRHGGLAARPIAGAEAVPTGPGVYFLRSGTDGPIKIGWSRNIATRFVTLARESGHRLYFLGAVAGGSVEEHALHDRFAAQRLHGEWFEPSDELWAAIASAAAAPLTSAPSVRRDQSLDARRLTFADPEVAKPAVLTALRATRGNITHAAAALGVSRATLGRLLLRLGLAGEVAAAWPRADRG
jgi:DNA-binding NtrC family response regulator